MKSISLHSITKYSLQVSHLSTHSSVVSLPMLHPGPTTPNYVYDEAGSETVEFLRSLDVLAKRSAKLLQNVRFACLQNWFGRAAWHVKLEFIVELLRASEGVSFLKQLLSFISTAPSKDANYLLSSQSSGTSNNRVLMDNNRELDLETMRNLMILDKMWYRTLEEEDQLQVLLDLLILGGGILTYKVFLEALYILEERLNANKMLQFVEDKRKDVEEEEQEDYEEEEDKLNTQRSPILTIEEGSNLNVAEEKKKGKDKKKKKPKKEKPTSKEKKQEEKISSIRHDTTSRKSGSKLSFTVENFYDVDEDETVDLEFKEELAAQIEIWKQKLQTIRNAVKTIEPAKNEPEKKEKKKPGKKAKKEKETIKELQTELDFLQMMPPPVSKAIFCLLDTESREAARKVNKFWAITMDSVEKEEVCRQNLKNDIARMSIIEYPSHMKEPPIPVKTSSSLNTTDSAGLKTIYKPSSGRLPKDKKSGSALQVRILNGTETYPSHNLIPFQHSSSSKSANFDSRNIKSLKKIKDLLGPSISSRALRYERMYKRKHCIVRIIKDFVHMRVMACGFGERLMAVTNGNHGVDFYSLITGAKVSAELQGHSGMITCMQFHPEGFHIITGSTDKLARCWHIWSGKIIMSYIGHENKINALSTSQDLVATADDDGRVKVFHVWSGLLNSTFEGKESVTALCLDVKSSQVFVGFRNGHISVYNYDTKTLGMSIKGHELEVTDLCLVLPLLISSSYDGLAKIWEVGKSQLNHLFVLEHGRAVRNVNVVSMQVLCGCHGGCLWVWSLLNGQLIYKLTVGTNAQPLYDVHCTDEKDHVKIVVSGEPGVSIYEFHPTSKLKRKKANVSTPCGFKSKSDDIFLPIDSQNFNTKHLKPGLNETTLCNDLGMSARKTQKSQRLTTLEMRGTVDPSLRYPKNAPITKKCFVSNLCTSKHKIFNPETGNLIAFPRLAMCPEKYKLPRKVPHVEWSEYKRNDFAKPKRQSQTHKNMLQQYNAHEVIY